MGKVEKKIGYFTSFDETPVYFESRGRGEPIVFVYGIACLINHWHHQIDFFSHGHRTLVLDLRGHHKTPKPDDLSQLNIKSLGKDLKSLLDHLKISAAHFVGHSFGAQVILSGYESNPEIFKSITLINGFASNPIKDMFGLGLVEKVYAMVHKGYRQNPALWKRLWKASVENPLSIPFTSIAGGFNVKLTNLSDIQVYVKGVANIDLEVFLTLFAEMMNFDGRSILPHIKCPTLIVSGENDRVTPKPFQEALAQHIPHSQLLVVPYGSHCTQLDFPDYINLRLEKFISTIKHG